MRILHLSHNGLPDMRVERAAQTAKKDGHTMCFSGPFIKGTGFPIRSFHKFYELPFNKFANAKIPSYWGTLKRKLSRILDQYRPDLIHAHNIVAAKLASEFSISFIYDDHEYWSKRFKAQARIGKPNKMYIRWLWTRWEKEVLRKAPATITVSRTVAEEHKRLCKHVYVAPNFPSRIESESLKMNFRKDNLSSVYVGTDCSRPSSSPYRNVEGLLQIFHDNDVGTLTVLGDPTLCSSRNIKSLGFLPHQTMMQELTKHHIGLLPWKKHWFHKYSNPNKPYEYTHAGLLVLTVSDFPCVTRHLEENCIVFDNYQELRELLLFYADDLDEINELRVKIRKFALENLTWEKRCESEILNAYSRT